MPMQFETVALVGAGWARFDGADTVVKITDAPTETSAASAALWAALFGTPTDGQPGGNLRYITNVDLTFSAGGAFMTPMSTGTAPDANSGYPCGDESYRNMADTIRDARFFLPTGVSMYVRPWWGRL